MYKGKTMNLNRRFPMVRKVEFSLSLWSCGHCAGLVYARSRFQSLHVLGGSNLSLTLCKGPAGCLLSVGALYSVVLELK